MIPYAEAQVQRPDPRAPRAFTLVELLIVIAIIALLMALLMPALKGIRERVKTVQCANNERQIGVGYSGFLADHGGFYPYADPIYIIKGTTTNIGWTPSRPWTYVLSPYLAGSTNNYNKETYRKLLQCPANPWPFPKTAPWWAFNVLLPPISYPMNKNMFPIGISDTGGCGDGGVEGTHDPYCWCRRVKVSEIANPSGVALSGEMPFTTNSANAFGAPLPTLGPPNVGFMQNSFDWRTTNSPSGFGNVYWRREDTSNINSVFHNLGANILFVDGHVQRIAKRTLFDYQTQWQASGSGSKTTGAIFWNDGKGFVNFWYLHQFPGAPWPWDPEYY